MLDPNNKSKQLKNAQGQLLYKSENEEIRYDLSEK
jgi:hypothetical protein